MCELNNLLKAFKNCKDTSENPLVIITNTIDADVLDACRITYDDTAEGVSIDLSSQLIKIYKSKQDVITYFDSDGSNPILIIKDELIYKKDEITNTFFENLFYSRKIKELFENKELISYIDELNQKYIFLSEDLGKVEIGYRNKLLDFCNQKYNISDMYDSLKVKFEENEYISFFRNNFIKVAKNINSVDDRFFETLISLSNISENSNREFELFKNKFSFDQFHSEVKKEKEKYIKNIQENLSEFLSKVNALPVQFGVYILLVFRFQDEVIPLVATVILIISWSAFSFFSLSTMRKTINFLERKFNNVFDKISKESGIEKEVLAQDREEVENKISDIKNMICWYKWVVVIFSLTFITFSGSNIYQEFNKADEKINTNQNNITMQDINSSDINTTMENNQTLKLKKEL